MDSSHAADVNEHRILFLTRDPVVHEQSGSTTYIFGLLALLQARGAEVTLVSTTAHSRSPRLFFRLHAAPPFGVDLRFPGYLRLGSLYVLPWRLKAWARALARVAVRRSYLQGLARWCERMYGAGLYTGAWDLTVPTPAECEAAVREADAAKASVVVANYGIWGLLLGDGRFGQRRTAILMHDLLSARARRFQESGTPLDMPMITEDEEMRWLSGADTVLAAQAREAELIRSRVTADVVVTPVLLHPRALPPKRITSGRCLFVGSNIAPNRSGLEFMLQAVWPRVRAAVPGATLAIAGTVGQVLTGEAQGSVLSSLGLDVLGVVPSLEEEYARAAVCVVPLLLGTGIKIKLLEALELGKAVVSTSVGIEGLEAWAHQAVAVADDPEAFADAIIRLLSDEAERIRQEMAALRCADEHFGPKQELDPQFLRALL